MKVSHVELSIRNQATKNPIISLRTDLKLLAKVLGVLLILQVGHIEDLHFAKSAMAQQHPANSTLIPINSECTSHTAINALLGGTPWESLPAPQVNGIVVNELPEHGDGHGMLVHEPIIQIDKSDGTYLANAVAPAGGSATLWFDTPIEISGQECQAQSAQLPDATQTGVAHVDPAYSFRAQNALIEGSDKIYEIGFRAIFAYLVTAGGNESVNIYKEAVNSIPLWPDTTPTTLVELAQTIPFQQLFQKNFSTYVLTAYSTAIPAPLQGAERLSEAELVDEETQFYELTKHLLSTYANSNKIFILKQHTLHNW